MKELQLTNDSRKALVDDEDFNRCYYHHKWGFNNSGIRTTTNPRITLQNFIMRDLDNLYDHVDRNIFNNQKKNLRIATWIQNNYNKGKLDRFRSSTSEYKGVYWNKKDKRWMVRIQYDKKAKFIGSFKIEKEAAHAYDRAAIKYHGEFACLNFPKEDYL